jgi:hypothetical protein
MAITKPPVKKPANMDDFIAGAPDAAPVSSVKPHRENKQQITFTITPSMLAKVDEMASGIGQSRSAFINMAICQAVENGVNINAKRG